MGREHMLCNVALAETTRSGARPVARSLGRVRSCQTSPHRALVVLHSNSRFLNFCGLDFIFVIMQKMATTRWHDMILCHHKVNLKLSRFDGGIKRENKT